MLNLNKDAVQKIIIATLLILLLAALYALYIPLKIVINSARFFQVGGQGDASAMADVYNKTGTYKIDVDTILESIDLNQVFVFPPETNTLNDSITNNNLSWGQAEYLKIAGAFFEFVWKESLDERWSIHRLIFDTNCKEDLDNFESAAFVFYQLILQQGELQYEARAINISQLDGSISWGGDNVFYRPIFGANVIELDKLKISADEALNIAEENGGKTLRQSVQNKCELSLRLYGNWDVEYDTLVMGPPFLDVFIDPYTGMIIKLR